MGHFAVSCVAAVETAASQGECPTRAWSTASERGMIATTLLDPRLRPPNWRPSITNASENAYDESRPTCSGPGSAAQQDPGSGSPGSGQWRTTRSGAIHAAARQADDPDRLSFVHAVRVIRRRIQNPGAFPPGGPTAGPYGAGRDSAGCLQPRATETPWRETEDEPLPHPTARSSVHRQAFLHRGAPPLKQQYNRPRRGVDASCGRKPGAARRYPSALPALDALLDLPAPWRRSRCANRRQGAGVAAITLHCHALITGDRTQPVRDSRHNLQPARRSISLR